MKLFNPPELIFRCPEMMLLALPLFPLPLLVLSSTPGVCVHNASSKYISPLFESLQCFNDYSSHIRCSWMESAEANRTAPFTLYHIDNNGRKSPCVSHSPAKAHSGHQLEVWCQYNTTLFAVAIQHAFFFKTPTPRSTSMAIKLSQHTKVRPPQGLSQRVIGSGGRVFYWQSPLSSTSALYSTLSYQLSYRRLGHDWTLLDVSETETKIEPELLVPGSKYEGRVRARSSSGLWSDWSSSVLWHTEEVVPHDGPYNLRCLSDGEGAVRCSWEVKRDLNQHITYNLSYRTNHSALAQWCCGTVLHTPDPQDSVLQFSCSFSAPHTEELWVELTPTHNTKTFPSTRYFWPSSPNPVQLKDDGIDWVLSWTRPNSKKADLSYEMCYWSLQMEDNRKCLNFSGEMLRHRFYGASLKPSTNYMAQVRALPAGVFSGRPSNWTEPVDWTTNTASWSISTLIYVFVGVLVTIFFFSLIATLPAFKRRIVRWEVSLPSPTKSNVLEEILKCSTSAWVPSHIEKTRICQVQVLDSEPPPSLSAVDWYSFSSLHSLCEEKRHQENSSTSFNGPYLLCPATSQSLGNLHDTSAQLSIKASRSWSLSSTSKLAESLKEATSEYVRLPSATAIASPSDDVTLGGYIHFPFSAAEMPGPKSDIKPNLDLPVCDPPAYTPGHPNVLSTLLEHMCDHHPLVDGPVN